MKRVVHCSKQYSVDEVNFVLSQLSAVNLLLPVPAKYRETEGEDILDFSQMLLLSADNELCYTDSDGVIREMCDFDLQAMRAAGYKTFLYSPSQYKRTVLQYLCVKSICGTVVETNTLADALVAIYCRFMESSKYVGTKFSTLLYGEYNKRVVNRHIYLNQFVENKPDTYTDLNTDWDDVVYDTYETYAGIQDWFERHRSYCQFTDKYPSFNHHETLVRLINKVDIPRYNLLGADRARRSFDTVTVELGLTKRNKEQRDATLRKYSKVLAKCILEYISSTERWQSFGVPITVLKPDKFTITKDERLVMVFSLKDRLVAIADECLSTPAK